AVGPQIILPQISRQTAGPCPGSGEQNHAVSLLLPARQIFDQKLKTILIGAYIFHLKAEPAVYFYPRDLLIQPGHEKTVWTLGLGQHLSCRIEKLRLPREEIAFLQPVNHTLPEFHLHSPSLFPKP